MRNFQTLPAAVGRAGGRQRLDRAGHLLVQFQIRLVHVLVAVAAFGWAGADAAVEEGGAGVVVVAAVVEEHSD